MLNWRQLRKKQTISILLWSTVLIYMRQWQSQVVCMYVFAFILISKLGGLRILNPWNSVIIFIKLNWLLHCNMQINVGRRQYANQYISLKSSAGDVGTAVLVMLTKHGCIEHFVNREKLFNNIEGTQYLLSSVPEPLVFAFIHLSAFWLTVIYFPDKIQFFYIFPASAWSPLLTVNLTAKLARLVHPGFSFRTMAIATSTLNLFLIIVHEHVAIN